MGWLPVIESLLWSRRPLLDWWIKQPLGDGWMTSVTINKYRSKYIPVTQKQNWWHSFCCVQFFLGGWISSGAALRLSTFTALHWWVPRNLLSRKSKKSSQHVKIWICYLNTICALAVYWHDTTVSLQSPAKLLSALYDCWCNTVWAQLTFLMQITGNSTPRNCSSGPSFLLLISQQKRKDRRVSLSQKQQWIFTDRKTVAKIITVCRWHKCAGCLSTERWGSPHPRHHMFSLDI